MSDGQLSCFYHQRMNEIKYSIEMLNYGLSELEAVYVRLTCAGVITDEHDRAQAKQSAKVLNARNHYLAHAINKALKEVESNLLSEGKKKGGGLDDTNNKQLLMEFSGVLRQSIRTLQLYCQIHETYYNYVTTNENNRGSAVEVVSEGKKTKNCKGGEDPGKKSSSCQKFRSIFKTVCICSSSDGGSGDTDST